MKLPFSIADNLNFASTHTQVIESRLLLADLELAKAGIPKIHKLIVQLQGRLKVFSPKQILGFDTEVEAVRVDLARHEFAYSLLRESEHENGPRLAQARGYLKRSNQEIEQGLKKTVGESAPAGFITEAVAVILHKLENLSVGNAEDRASALLEVLIECGAEFPGSAVNSPPVFES